MYVNWPVCGSSLTVLQNPQLPQGMQIQGMAGLGCDCRGCRGLGLFDSGLNLSGWGWPEWLAVVLGVYVVVSVFTTSRRGYGRRRQRRERREDLQLRGGGFAA